MKKVEAKILFG